MNEAFVIRLMSWGLLFKGVGYPVVVRPSNVLGGRAMEILFNELDLELYLKYNGQFILDGPILIDKFWIRVVSIADVDALSDGESVFVAGISNILKKRVFIRGILFVQFHPIRYRRPKFRKIEDSTMHWLKA